MDSKDLKTKEMNELFEAIAKLQTTEEARKFLRDLCTLPELKAMAERFQVVQKVDVNMPYRQIAKETGSSTATITRVAHWLHHGMGGYRLMLDRLKS